jgi:solute carrier family 25 thiamine pyrophosphate transporter 19
MVHVNGNDGVDEVKHRAVLDATAGALAGAVARFVVGPLDVLKIRFQVQLEPIAGGHPRLSSKYTGLRQALVTIVREEGIQVAASSFLHDVP